MCLYHLDCRVDSKHFLCLMMLKSRQATDITKLWNKLTITFYSVKLCYWVYIIVMVYIPPEFEDTSLLPYCARYNVAVCILYQEN